MDILLKIMYNIKQKLFGGIIINYEGKIITCNTYSHRGKVYLVENGSKKWILSTDVLKKMESIYGNTITVSDKVLNEIYTSEETIPLADEERKKAIKKDETRWEISKTHIKGTGIEIGALHNPLPINNDVCVKYLDILSTEENIKRYPEIPSDKILQVSIIDDGEILSRIEFNSIDFIIASHFLEHCQNPLGTIRTHLSKLKNNGILYYIVPNKDFTFDKGRPLTTFEHLLKDDSGEPENLEHYREYVHFVDKVYGPHAKDHVKILMDMDNRIHFHVWDEATIKEFLSKVQQYFDYSFMVEYFVNNVDEFIIIIKKVI